MTTDKNALQILERERDFHNRRYAHSEDHRSESRFYYALRDLNKRFLDVISEHCNNADVLDYGCGTGERAAQLDLLYGPKSVTGIDISEEAVRSANEKILVKDSTLRFLVDNCENTSLPSSSFDLIYGNGIIHHLNTEKSIVELKRLLRPKGVIAFYEPLGTNPLINLYRKLTPHSRTTDEHPLLPSDLKLLERQFPNSEFTFYGFFTLLTLPIYRDSNDSIVFNIASRMDRKFLRLNLFKWLAWSVLIVCKK